MKHFSTFCRIVTLLFSVTLFAQPNYKKVIYTSPPYLHSSFMLATKNNAAFDFGTTTDQPFISKLDSTGNIKWARSYSTNAGNFSFFDAVNSYDSTSAVAGMSYTNNLNSGSSLICIKLEANGDTAWCRQYSHTTFTTLIPYSISSTNDSGFVICGSAWGPSDQTFIAKITKSGNLSWMKTLAVSFYRNFGYCVKQTPDSGFVLTGGIQNTGGTDYCTFIARLDKSGTISWSKKYYESLSQNTTAGYGLTVETDGYLVLTNSVAGHHVLIKTDFSGNILWTKHYSTFINYSSYNLELPMTLRKTSGNGRQITDRAADYGGGIVLVTDTLGAVKWSFYSMYSGIDVVQLTHKSFMMMVNPSAVVVRVSGSSINGNLGVSVTDSLGIDSSGCHTPQTVSITAITFSVSNLSSSLTTGGAASGFQPNLGFLTFSQNAGCLDYGVGIKENDLAAGTVVFPNPAHGKITIESDALENRDLLFELRDVTGRILKTKQMETGNKKAEIDLGSVKPGVYFYALSSGAGVIKTGKILISE